MIGDTEPNLHMNDENVDVNQPRKSARARKPVQQFVAEPTSSPRATSTTPKKTQTKKSETFGKIAEISGTPGVDSSVYIELDPFAPPPRLSLSGLQSPMASSTPQKAFVQMNNLIEEKTLSAAKSKNTALPPYSGGLLFEQLSSSGIAIKTIVDDWLQLMESGKQRREIVALLLVNLVLWASRVENDIKPEHFVTESASQILHDLQENIEPVQTKSEFPLFDRNKKTRAFRTQFSDFWSMWAASVLPAATDLELIEKVVMPWLISMSSAGYRPIRYAATLAMLDIVQGCCKACIALQKDLETKNRVKRASGSKKTVEAISNRIAEIEGLMQMSIDAVFVQRYRDVDPLIRERCVNRMLSWITTYPAVFLENAYLRYVGWSLSDKAAAVRLASLEAWGIICERVEFRPALGNFVNRFKARLFEVLCKDVDKSCRLEAAKVIDVLFLGSFLETEEMQFVDDLIFSGSATIANLPECMSHRIFNHAHGTYLKALKSNSAFLEKFSLFISPYMNSETSAEANNFILKQLILNLREAFPFLNDLSSTADLLKRLISSESTAEDEDANMADSETSEKISCLLAVLFSQVQCFKTRKGSSWSFDDSAMLFNFVNEFMKFINDNEREIYSKDIFYLFSLLNEVESSRWLDIAPQSAWEDLLPILVELFCSIDDMESAKVALNFFKRAKGVAVLKDKVMECVVSGKGRLLNELLRSIPGTMREALKIKDTSILTLVLPLSHMNLLCPLGLEDSGKLASILNMTKLIDEFVSIEDVYKGMIWTCSLRLVFHELMWKMMESRDSSRALTSENDILEIRDRLIDLLNPADYVPESLNALKLETFERLSTSINVLADLSLLFAHPLTGQTSPLHWSVILPDDQALALCSFVRMITKLTADPLPSREDEGFELARAAKKSFPAIIASIAKLFSLDVLPLNQISTLFMTRGFGDEIGDAVIKVVLDRQLPKLALNEAIPIISATLQSSYMMAVMSADYERFLANSTLPLAKAFYEYLRTSPSVNLFSQSPEQILKLHRSAIEFFGVDGAQRSEFLGRVTAVFAPLIMSPKQFDELSGVLKSVAFSDSFSKSYLRALEKNSQRGNVAQRLLLAKRATGSSSLTPTKSSKLQSVPEETQSPSKFDEKDLAEDFEGDAIDESELLDTNTQLNENSLNFEQLPSSPPAILKRKVFRY